MDLVRIISYCRLKTVVFTEIVATVWATESNIHIDGHRMDGKHCHGQHISAHSS